MSSVLEPFVVAISLIVFACLTFLTWVQAREIRQLRRERLTRFNRISELNRLERSRLIVEDTERGVTMLDASLATLFDVAGKEEDGVLVREQLQAPKRIRLETWSDLAEGAP